MTETVQYVNLPVIFGNVSLEPEDPEEPEDLEDLEDLEDPWEERIEQGLPELPGLIFKPSEEPDIAPAPPSIFGEWKGLKAAIKAPKELEVGVIDEVILPNISSQIVSIPEAKRIVTVSPGQLRQEKVLEILNKIEVGKLENSIIFPKGGYSLPKLKGFAKQLGISTADLRKAGVAQRILEKIQLKGELEA